MAIIVKVGEKANEKKVRLELNIRKSLNGDLMIFDHGDVDIILSTKQNKVVGKAGYSKRQTNNSSS